MFPCPSWISLLNLDGWISFYCHASNPVLYNVLTCDKSGAIVLITAGT